MSAEAEPKTPRPTVEQLSLRVERSYWTANPNGTYSVRAEATFTPDHKFSSGQNLDVVHRLLVQRLDTYVGGIDDGSAPIPNGGDH
jgi:hypothetical protein